MDSFQINLNFTQKEVEHLQGEKNSSAATYTHVSPRAKDKMNSFVLLDVCISL